MQSQTYSQITVTLDHVLSISRRSALVERLQRISGVVEAVFDSTDIRTVTVFHRDGTLSPVTLLDYLSRQNASASVTTGAPALVPAHNVAA